MEEVVGFQVPTESIIHDSFHNFADAGGEGDRTELGSLIDWFSGFKYGTIIAHFQISGTKPVRRKRLKRDSRWTRLEDERCFFSFLMTFLYECRWGQWHDFWGWKELFWGLRQGDWGIEGMRRYSFDLVLLSSEYSCSRGSSGRFSEQGSSLLKRSRKIAALRFGSDYRQRSKEGGYHDCGGGRRDWSWVLGSITRLIELIWLSHEFLRVLLISCFFSASSLFHSNLPAIQADANQRLQVLRLRATRRLHSAVHQGLGGSFRLTEPVDLEKSLLAP